MFCDSCGTQLAGAANFCPTCGRNFGARPVAAAPPPPIVQPQGRVAGHVKTLAILWLVRSGLRLLPGLFLTSFFGRNWPFLDVIPWPVHGILRAVGTVFIVGALIGIILGWGLWERRPWARTLAIVLGILALFDFPLGTALGIYTLWVMGSSNAGMEYRVIARPA